MICGIRVHDDLPKTNNSVEGWHRRFETEVLGAYRLNIWWFMKCLHEEQSFNKIQIEQYVTGIEPEPQKTLSRCCKAQKKTCSVF